MCPVVVSVFFFRASLVNILLTTLSLAVASMQDV